MANRTSSHNLVQAAIENDLDDVRRLLQKPGIDIDYLDYGESSALMMAAQEGYTDIVRLLLEKGANVNVTNNTGMNALLYAVNNGHIEVVKQLLNVDGLDVNHQASGFRTTSLMLAAANGYGDIVTLLLNKGADVHLENFEGETALNMATNDTIRQSLREASGNGKRNRRQSRRRRGRKTRRLRVYKK